MGPAAIQNVKMMMLPLLVRTVSTGALLGAGLSAGAAGFSTVQAALYPEQFGAWGWNAGQILSITFVGFAIGAVAGLATGAGSVAALWIDTTTSSSPALPRSLTAGAGAAVTTFLYTTVVVSVSGLPGLAAVEIGAVLAAVAGLLAAFHTRRLVRMSHRGTPKPTH